MVPAFITAACLIILSTLASGMVQLKVGLYNSIPDLQGDGLTTLKNMVEEDFNNADWTVNAVIDPIHYSPYAADLNNYLDGDFDMIEIDTASLLDIKDKIMDINAVTPMQAGTLQTAKNSVTVGDKSYGYPTLACGNFMVALSPGTGDTCPLDKEHLTFFSIVEATDICKENFVPDPYARLLGGKMNDVWGWYLPFLYLDVYVDMHEPNSIEDAVNQVTNNDFDKGVCEGLEWLYDQCEAQGETLENNKCFGGSYVQESLDDLKNDIIAQNTLTFFGFSEVSAEIQKDTGAIPYGVTSWPFSDDSYMLQFTDALVVSKKAWDEGDEEKRNAIRVFINYFTGLTLRRKIALGEDLDPVLNRYLLQAITEFYESVLADPIYSSAYRNLVRSVAAPSLTAQQKETMQAVLQEAIENGCVIATKEKIEL